MQRAEYRGIYFEDQGLQARFEALLAAVDAAEQAREPLARRHKTAERDADKGDLSDSAYRAIDDQFIAANNKIAAAKREIDAFLTQNRDYKIK